MEGDKTDLLPLKLDPRAYRFFPKRTSRFIKGSKKRAHSKRKAQGFSFMDRSSMTNTSKEN